MELAAVVQAGSLDRQATIESWVADYGDSILKLAYLYLNDRHLAEDVFQDVFTRAYVHLGRFRGESSPKTLLYRITVNFCRDHLGAWNARHMLLLGEGCTILRLLGVRPWWVWRPWPHSVWACCPLQRELSF